jgi:UDP-N-acetylmuramate--alanine ligase
MINLNHISRIYFIGIGGIGMSALARFFLAKHIAVSGYDRTPTPLTDQLVREGMSIHFEDNPELADQQADLIVYTPAIPANHNQLNWFRNQGKLVVKRSDVLQAISQQMRAICVGGTHGKTTISTLIAFLLRETGVGCNAFLGGISSNYGVNYWYSDNPLAVIEADEYDRSFLKLNPAITIISAMDADHLDIYGTVEEMERCYLEFISNTQETLIYKHGLARSAQFIAPSKVSYSLQNDAAAYSATDIKMHQGSYTFTLLHRGNAIGEFTLHQGGMHNVENTVAALAVCHLLEIDMSLVANALQQFKGVRRRFEYIIKTEKLVYIDDYAHHPEELRMLISSARTLFASKKVSIIFQPHLFSRTRDLADGFAESLDLADEVILLDIYPARELPMEGVSSQLIMDKMALNNKHIMSAEAALRWVEASTHEVLITAGAGNIDAIVIPISNLLNQKTA